MKRTAAYLITLVVLLSFAPARQAQADTFEFDAIMCNEVDQTASTWYTNSTSRAGLVLLLSFDFVNDNIHGFTVDSLDLSKPFAIAKDDIHFTVFLQTDAEMIMLSYTPMTGYAAYATVDIVIDSESLMIDMLTKFVSELGYDSFDLLTLEDIENFTNELGK